MMSDQYEAEEREQEARDNRPDRLKMGEAFMMCNDCGARLHSFDGYQDKGINCPYEKRVGPFAEKICEPPRGY